MRIGVCQYTRVGSGVRTKISPWPANKVMYEHTGHGMLHGIAEESLRKMNRTGLKARVLLWYQAGIGTRKNLFETFASNVQRNLLSRRTSEKNVLSVVFLA